MIRRRFLAGQTFVITGSVEHFANRNELKAFIEARGGRTAGSVSSKTSCLINNDTASTSIKEQEGKRAGNSDFVRDGFPEYGRRIG